MPDHTVVSGDEWLAARQELLTKEKEFTHLRDELSQARRALPWEKIGKNYVFDGPNGKETLADLFDGRSQLVIYHFMLGPDWDEGCPSCSFWADNYDGIDIHLKQRDITLISVSRSPLENINAYKNRMGWRFKWVSSIDSDFNFDFNVSFTPSEMKKGEMNYNYRNCKFPMEEAPGFSVFFRDDQGDIFHTYSCFSRGLDMLNGAYHIMDMVPKGRDEDQLPFSMAWVNRHDQYEA